jgi:hypothetical protein
MNYIRWVVLQNSRCNSGRSGRRYGQIKYDLILLLANLINYATEYQVWSLFRFKDKKIRKIHAPPP